MLWVLPGGAILGGRNREGEELVAYRPQAAVEVRTSPPRTVPGQPDGQATEPAPQPEHSQPTLPPPPRTRQKSKVKRRSGRQNWLSTVKRVLEVLAILVGLIGAILALLGALRK